jgi:hypothetical protein
MKQRNRNRRIDQQRAIFDAISGILPDLKALTGFVDAGAGLMRVQGQLTPVLSIDVQDWHDALQLARRAVPPIIGGFQTQVRAHKGISKAACIATNNPARDDNRYRYVAGGMMISNPHRDHAGYPEIGTIGCIANYQNPLDAADPNNGMVILGCNHVFNNGGLGVGCPISQPVYANSLCRCYECASLVAFDIDFDCAIAKINEGVLYRNTILEMEEGIAGAGTVVDRSGGIDIAVAIGDVVCKRGFMTQITTGTVSYVAASTYDFKITPTAGVSHFVKKGDSGSVIINEIREVVGLLAGSEAGGTYKDALGATQDVETGIGIATHIHPILDAMHITLSASTEEDLNPTTGAAGLAAAYAKGRVDARQRISAKSRPPGRKPLLPEGLLASIAQQPYGDEIIDFVDHHGAEIQSLIQHQREVRVVWNRHHGPDFAGVLLHQRHQLGRPSLPISIKGIHRETMLLQMAAVLQAHGSGTLRDAIFQNAWRMLEGIRAWDLKSIDTELNQPTTPKYNGR